MALIYTRKSKNGMLKYYGDLTINGRRYRRALGLSRETAVKALKKLENDLLFGEKSNQYYEMDWYGAQLQFLVHVELSGIAVEQRKHIQSKCEHFHQYCQQLGNKSLGDVRSEVCTGYIKHRSQTSIRNKYNYAKEGKWAKPSTATINKEIAVLRRFFNFCLNNQWIDQNPWTRIQRIKDNTNGRPRYYFTDRDLERIFDNAGKFGDFYYFLLHTGLRSTDAFTLIPDSFDGSYMSLRMKKTGAWLRSIPISDHVIERLKGRLGSDKQYVFPELQSDRQRRYARKGVQSLFEPDFVRKHNINLHTFRHTYAHSMLNKGMPKEVLQTFLGHRSIRTTEIYANWVNSTELDKWVE